MQQSSQTVSALAAALAKAQIELTNPEKSLVGTLPAKPGQSERTFRYASLADGLDIVRKTLGRHEIATIQSTAIDRDSGTIRLITTLAHGSGEWIASDWPVCGLSDLASPRRMGAALTYARRYALFTLVGIAGDDDLDAPELPFPTQIAVPPRPAPRVHKGNGKSHFPTPVILDAATSCNRRDELLGELRSIAALDAAAEWAKRIIPLKNTMTAEHARDLEAAFEVKISQFGGSFEEPRPAGSRPPSMDPGDGSEWLATSDRSTLKFGHAPRRRNKAHLRFVAAQPCLLCQRQPSDAHHLRFAQSRALGRKVSDEFTVPLCRTHHRQLHSAGKEEGWWKAMAAGIDPLAIARKYWEESNRELTTL
jgi:hypothetical protein